LTVRLLGVNISTVIPAEAGKTRRCDHVGNRQDVIVTESGEKIRGRPQLLPSSSDAFEAIHEAALDYCNPRPGHEREAVGHEGVVSTKGD